jgi:hypothetical protein
VIPKFEWKQRFGTLKGVNQKDNVVLLTIEQHAECHKWLWEQFGRWQDQVAFKFLSGQITKKDVQREMGRQVGLSRRGVKRVFTPEHRENLKVPKTLSIARQEQLRVMASKYAFRKGNKPWNSGKIASLETKEKIRAARLLYWERLKHK